MLLPAAARSEFDILRIILERPRDLQSGMSDLPKEIFRDLPIRGMHHAITGSEFQLECPIKGGAIDCILTSLWRETGDLSMVREGRRVEVDAERRERKEIKSYKFGL